MAAEMSGAAKGYGVGWESFHAQAQKEIGHLITAGEGFLATADDGEPLALLMRHRVRTLREVSERLARLAHGLEEAP